MRYMQFLFITVVVASVSGGLSSYDRKGKFSNKIRKSLKFFKNFTIFTELPLIIGNAQNKLATLTSANNLATSQIAANTGVLNNIQTQLNQVVTTNTATKVANDATNAKLTSLILTFSSLSAALGSTYTANNYPAVGAAYTAMATAIGAI